MKVDFLRRKVQQRRDSGVVVEEKQTIHGKSDLYQ
jgi:hypothetical protein